MRLTFSVALRRQCVLPGASLGNKPNGRRPDSKPRAGSVLDPAKSWGGSPGAHGGPAPAGSLPGHRDRRRPCPPCGLIDNLRQTLSMSEDVEPEELMATVTDDNYADFIRRDDGQLVVVQFHAEWCKPCKATIPLVRKLARKHRKVIFGSYECDKSRPLLPKSVGITAFPAFIMYRAGEKIGMLKGSTCLGELMRIVENHDQP